MEAGGKLVTWCRQMIADPNFPNFEQFEDGLFHIPWMDQKRAEWREDDEYSRTLHEYTLYFQPNEVAGKDYKTWKARLRNALRKSNYIERLKDLDELTGPTPHMVCKFKRQSASYDHSSSIDELGDSNSGQDYEMVSEDSQSWERSQEFQEGMDVAPSWPQTSDHLINGHGDVAPSWPQTSDHPINGHGVVAPSWPQTSDHPINGHGGVAPSWPQTSDHVINGHGGVAPSWPQTSDHPINGHGEVDQTWPQNFENMNGLVAHDELLPHTYTPLDKPADLETLLTSQSIEQRIQTLFDKRMHQTEATPEPLLIIDVLYDSPNKNVKTFTLKADVPQCHLFAQTVHDQTLQRKIQGDRQEIQFELPDLKSVPDISKKFKSKIEKVLDNFTTGVSIKYHNHNIYVQRRCSPPVSFSDDVSKTESLKRKTGAEEFDLIFDYKEFLNSLVHHMQHPDSPAPKDYALVIVAGKYLVHDTSPMRKVPIHFKIRHMYASQDLSDCSERRGDVFDFSSLFSTMDSLDQEIKAAKDREKCLNK